MAVAELVVITQLRVLQALQILVAAVAAVVVAGLLVEQVVAV
jgi:hypothetical protein